VLLSPPGCFSLHSPHTNWSNVTLVFGRTATREHQLPLAQRSRFGGPPQASFRTLFLRATVAKSVQRLATGWMTERRSEFQSRSGQECSFLHTVQTGCGAHTASYPMGTGDFFPGGNEAGPWSWHSPPITAEVKKMWSTHPLTRMSSRRSYAQGQFYLFTGPYNPLGTHEFVHFSSVLTMYEMGYSMKTYWYSILPPSSYYYYYYYYYYLLAYSVALDRKRTIPTERPTPVSEVSANFCG
jgi:hypothetical protein